MTETGGEKTCRITVICKEKGIKAWVELWNGGAEMKDRNEWRNWTEARREGKQRMRKKNKTASEFRVDTASRFVN